MKNNRALLIALCLNLAVYVIAVVAVYFAPSDPYNVFTIISVISGIMWGSALAMMLFYRNR